MSWDAIGAVGELLGALGVIASLIYLAIQIRQNTESVRMASHHGVADQFQRTSLVARWIHPCVTAPAFTRFDNTSPAIDPW
jgi:hypothetical protein